MSFSFLHVCMLNPCFSQKHDPTSLSQTWAKEQTVNCHTHIYVIYLRPEDKYIPTQNWRPHTTKNGKQPRLIKFTFIQTRVFSFCRFCYFCCFCDFSICLDLLFYLSMFVFVCDCLLLWLFDLRVRFCCLFAMCLLLLRVLAFCVEMLGLFCDVGEVFLFLFWKLHKQSKWIKKLKTEHVKNAFTIYNKSLNLYKNI